jgi:hypothetical protein
MLWEPKHPRARPEWLGFLPSFFSESNPEPAAKQVDRNYSHGGGWQPFNGFKMNEAGELVYPGDPPMRLLYEARLRDEVLRFYDGQWLAIMQPDGSFEVSRVD